jgi:hypothetical protein
VSGESFEEAQNNLVIKILLTLDGWGGTSKHISMQYAEVQEKNILQMLKG